MAIISFLSGLVAIELRHVSNVAVQDGAEVMVAEFLVEASVGAEQTPHAVDNGRGQHLRVREVADGRVLFTSSDLLVRHVVLVGDKKEALELEQDDCHAVGDQVRPVEVRVDILELLGE